MRLRRHSDAPTTDGTAVAPATIEPGAEGVVVSAEVNASVDDPSTWDKTVDKFTKTALFTAKSMRWLILGIVVAAALLGIAAIVVGVAAWHGFSHWHLPIGILIVVLACLPAVLLPLWVHKRTLPLTQAIEHPKDLLAQAHLYATNFTSNADLSAFTSVAKRKHRFRPTNLWKMTKALAVTTERVQPSMDTEPLLAAFMPVYLKTLWVIVLVTAWALVAALVVLVVSVIALVAGWTP
ncbi:MAG: hypothetical protein QM728_04770 [Gordonia sp. (in: high G+C Gram-positive bacteria)]|uniref:hypothetical protein n=1 Tax=Gordonia sp. (in: high G+C Gram-positive bacteria) TaxID=84139 RepID=UPI0039E580B4